MNLDTNPPLVRKRELAKALGVSPRTIDDWVARRIIPYLAMSSRLHLFDPVQVRQVIVARFGLKPRE
jgi:predicted DNA-binding transcriptional regulator AlpA